MDEDVPDRGDVAVFDVDGAEKEGDTKGEGVKLEDEREHPEPAEAGGDAVDEGEDDDDTEVDAEVDEGGGGGGDHDDPFREADFAEKVAAGDDSVNSLASALSEEVPKDGAGQEVDGVVRDVVAEVEELCEDDVEDGKHQKRAQDSPKITEDGALIAELKIGLDEFSKQDAVPATEDIWYSHNMYYFSTEGKKWQIAP